MNASRYLATLDARIRALQGIITSWSIQREMDVNLGIGFIEGSIAFCGWIAAGVFRAVADGTSRFRLHYMDAQDGLIVRWDSAPHHKSFGTFPFHKHTPSGIAEHGAITLLEALDEVVKIVKV